MGIIRLSITFAESFKHLRINFMKLTRRLPEEKNIIRKSYLENDQQEHKEQKQMLQTLINKAGLSEIISGDTQLKVSTQGCKNTPLQTSSYIKVQEYQN